jgi:hypothetical protein
MMSRASEAATKNRTRIERRFNTTPYRVAEQCDYTIRMPLTELHCRVGLAVVFFALALGLWGAFAFLRGGGVSGSYLGAVAIGEILVLAQAVIGVLLIATGRFPPDVLHFLYGIVTALAWVAVYIYTHGQLTRRELAIYAVVSLFVMGLAMRGIMTGSAAPACVPF